VVVTAVAWLARPGRRGLQACEWATLGVFWVLQGVNQYNGLTDPEMTRVGERTRDDQVLIGNTWVLPWFAMIAGYSVLVPNGWRRTAAIVGVTAAAPVAVTLLASAANPHLAPDRGSWVYVQYALWGLIAVSISIYGAHQAGLLRKEAFEAKKFGRYRLVSKLGEGGMGEVHLAEHQLLRRPCVLKLIRSDRAGDPKLARRFEREVRLLSTLTHWNTVAVYDYGHTPDGTFYFVMEYLPGLTLDQLVARHGPLPPGRAVYLLRQVCRGLREAHAVGLIHRDVKPGNVIVCERGRTADVVKLLDFGLVRSAADDLDDGGKLTGEQVVIGTPAYLSPEQACGRPVDARSDIYSLGATAYYLLTGKPPFEKGRAMEVIAAHIAEAPRPPSASRSEVPADLSVVVMKCLEKDPSKRYQDVWELEAALAGCGCAGEWDEEKAAAWWKEKVASS
jgi:serine/threonine-protein kinase